MKRITNRPTNQAVKEASARLGGVASASPTNQGQQPSCILRLPEVTTRVGLSRASIYRHIITNNFPRPIPLGIRARGWVESEVTAWINARIERRANLPTGKT